MAFSLILQTVKYIVKYWNKSNHKTDVDKLVELIENAVVEKDILKNNGLI